MAARKNPHNGCFGTPPSVNFFSSVDEDAVEVNNDALEKELSEKIQLQTVKAGPNQPDGHSQDWTLSKLFSHRINIASFL